MKSKHAPAEKLSIAETLVQYEKVNSTHFINDLLDALPYVAAILNEERQIIYSNKVLLEQLGNISFDQILGKRPGEAILCENANNDTGGCGTTEKCRYCGAVNAILKSKKDNKKTSLECRINSVNKENRTSLDFLVTATPFKWSNESYTILAINDISNEKRRKALEKIFFHDVINKAGSLSSYINLIKDISDVDQLKEFLSLAGEISNELTEEILAQKELLAAENSELQLNIDTMYSLHTIEHIAEHWKAHPVAKNKTIKISNNSLNIPIITDPILVKRVLINIVKNALEASTSADTITLGCYQEESNTITFYVNNPILIPTESRNQIFNRSFSTKGADRGLGTYSMKLLGEHYLKGQVWFTSNETDKTTFYLKIPLELDK